MRLILSFLIILSTPAFSGYAGIGGGGGGGGSPGGSSGDLQWNRSGSFAGDTATTDGSGNLTMNSCTMGSGSNTGTVFTTSGGTYTASGVFESHTATLSSASAGSPTGISESFATTGASSGSLLGHYVHMTSGSTTSGSNAALQVNNDVVSTGTTFDDNLSYHIGTVMSERSGSALSVDAMVTSEPGNSSSSTKLIGQVINVSGNGAAHRYGLISYAQSTSYMSTSANPGYFTFTNANGAFNLPNTSAALIADNRLGTTSPIFIGQANAVNEFELNATGGIAVRSGTNTDGRVGTATLASGTVTVSTTNIAANSIIFLSLNTPGGTPGFLSAPVASITAGTSFVINSSSGSDSSTVNWNIIDPL